MLGVIPARYASTRFPGKPLVDIRGKSMIQRVYERCLQAETLAAVTVATDDQRIFEHVQAFGGEVCMTRSDHRTGTDRVSEVARTQSDFTHYLNIQGDEPLISPDHIDALARQFVQYPSCEIATLVCPFEDAARIPLPQTVKVVVSQQGEALYFSRSPIPFLRQADPALTYWQHLGIYGFSRDMLRRIPDLGPSLLEHAESLEQLRWLDHGFRIRVAQVKEAGIAIDTPEDLAYLLAHWPE
ncbi:MAG: 3-deoxy-manno-octulosonate cytidylyltransferase [Bacteroidota bacterium]